MRQFEKLIEEKEISEIIAQMGKKITQDYKNKDLVVLCIMKGSFMFTSDLVRQINLKFPIYFLRAASYGDKQESSGKVVIEFSDGEHLQGKDVLVVEDIVDSGNTVVRVNEFVKQFSPKSITWAAFLSKPSRRVVKVDVGYIGKEIEDKFVIGYGLDLAEEFRNLPYVGIYKE